MATKQVYKYKIDKDVLKDFFATEKFTPEHQREVEKVITVVLIKHYSKYHNLFEELSQYAWTAILARKHRGDYDPTYCPYNYIYTTFRNEIGNNVIKLVREVSTEDILNFKERVTDPTEDELPLEVKRYQKHLTGEQDFSYLRIPKKDTLPLLIFIKLFEKKREIHVPEFILTSDNSVKVLYKLLKELQDDK